MDKKRIAILLMIFTTFLTSAAQIFYKKGADLLTSNLFDLFLNYNLMIGLGLYIVGSVLLILSLQKGDVSSLYPIIATSYVWVAILSNVFLGEIINLMKWIGIGMIIFGIISINRESKVVVEVV